MLTERYHPALRWLTATGVVSALLLSGCAGGGAPKKAALDVPATPTPTASGTPSASPPPTAAPSLTPLDLPGKQLALLGGDRAFSVASKAVSEFEIARKLQGQGDAVITNIRTLTMRRPIDCPQIAAVMRDAFLLSAQSQVPIQALPGDLAQLRALARAAAPRVAALQREIAAAMAQDNSADPGTADRLRAYATSANALEVNLQGAEPFIERVTTVYGRLTNSLGNLRSATLRAIKACSPPVARKSAPHPAPKIHPTAKPTPSKVKAKK